MPERYQVYYKCLKTGHLVTYCRSAMPLSVALETCMKFNDKYPGKAYPNGEGSYQVSEAWVEAVGV